MPFLRVLLFCLLSVSVRAFAQVEQVSIVVPVRGTVLMAKQEGKLWPLVDVKGRRGVVRLGDKELTLPREQSYLPVRNDDIAPGFIDLIDLKDTSHLVTDVLQPSTGFETSTTYLTGNQFETYLLSKTRIEDCCMALIYINKEFLDGNSSDLRFTMVLNRIGTLEAGKKKLVRLTITDIAANHFNAYSSVLFLSKGREVKSSISPVMDLRMAMVEARMHALSVERYVEEAKGQDKAVAVYSQERVQLPTLAADMKVPESVEALFTVDAEGNVGAVEIMQSVPSPVLFALQVSVRAWRFLPKLEHGRPVPCAVRLPISLKG